MASNELFFTGSDGEKHDASLHDEILNSPSTDLFTRINSFHSVVIEDDVSVEDALQIFNLKKIDLVSKIGNDVKAFRNRLNKQVVILP